MSCQLVKEILKSGSQKSLQTLNAVYGLEMEKKKKKKIPKPWYSTEANY